jgi:Zn-dependent protease/predicted transcriptional regulator
MLTGVRLFSIAGISIRVHASWLVIYGLITWTLAVGYFPQAVPHLSTLVSWIDGLVAALLLFVSVLLHELAHSFVAKAHGVSVRGITLHVFGGVSHLDDEPPDPRAEFLIAIAGPLTSFAIAAMLWGIRVAGMARSGSTGAIVGYLMFINLAVGAFNLVPGFPLDGGRLLRAALWKWKGTLEQATYLASRVGALFAIALMVLGLMQVFGGAFANGLWLILIGFFLYGAANASYAQIALREALGNLPVRDVMTTEVVSIPAEATIAELADAFWRHHFTSFPVVDGATVRGIVALRAVREIAPERWRDMRARDVMRPLADDLIGRPDETVYAALRKVSENPLGRIVVLDGDRMVGYLSISDITRRLALRGLSRTPSARRATSSREPPTRRVA